VRTSRDATERILRLAAVVIATAGLAGCASTASTSAPTPSGSPTCAVAAQPGVEPPEGCIEYDPEANMALNERYRDRRPLSDAAQAAGDALVAPVTAALETLRASGGPITDASVRTALAGAGLEAGGIQITAVPGSAAFGAGFSAPDGVAACVFGGISADAVTVAAGGIIMDGGCLALEGH
jgi:hypothetical protein